MSAMEPLVQLIGIDPKKLSKEEYMFLEMELFTKLYEAFREYARQQYKDYFSLMRLDFKQEETMLDFSLSRLLVKDILSTEEYTIEGVAYYTNVPVEIVEEVVLGNNTNPSALFIRKMMELHRLVRPMLYQCMMKKVLTGYKEQLEI